MMNVVKNMSEARIRAMRMLKIRLEKQRDETNRGIGTSLGLNNKCPFRYPLGLNVGVLSVAEGM